MPIPDIRINNLKIGDVEIPEMPRWLTTDLACGITNLSTSYTRIRYTYCKYPGCVQAHKDNNENVNLKNEDDKGTMTLCDAGTPSFVAIDYDANKINLEQEPPPPPAYKAPPKT